MALTTPDTATEIIDRAVNDVFLALQEVNAKPSLKNSWLNALIVAYANRIFDFYFALDDAAKEAIPDTAVAQLERWAAIWGISRTAGAKSAGNAVASGTVGGETIPKSAVLASGDGKRYLVRTAAAISTKSLSVASITLSGSVATLTTDDKHGLGSQILISVTGAVETEYNVTNSAMTITGDKTLTYAVTGAPSSPATGTKLLGFDSAALIVDSEDFGDSEDQVFDIALKFESPFSGVDDVARVDFDAIGGGADRELDTALRTRLLDRIQNPVAHFSAAEITALAKTVSGVTRVFVQENTPIVGQVTVFFMRDNDASPIPDGSEVTAVKNLLLTILPANTDTADLIVLAPTAVPTNFVFTDLQPNTAGMKTAVEDSLNQFFSERPTMGVDVDSDAYRSAIFNTIDPANGDEVTTFTLSAPTGDITIAAGEIGTLGTVTF